ncbi:MAG: hypothetical protein RSG22_18320 [Comamonas sp.]
MSFEVVDVLNKSINLFASVRDALDENVKGSDSAGLIISINTQINIIENFILIT